MLKHATVPEMYFNYIIIHKLFSVSYLLGQIASWAVVEIRARKGLHSFCPFRGEERDGWDTCDISIC